MKLKLDDQGHVVVKDGHPVYVHDDGSESPFDAAATTAAIRARNAEAKTHRERAEAAEAKLKTFDGIEDAEAARKALGIVKSLDGKTLVAADAVEQRLAEAEKVWAGKVTEAQTKLQTVEQQLNSEVIGGAFARSKFITEKVAAPIDMVQATFGPRFKMEDGKAKAYDANGNPVFSRKNPGAPADFEEAIEILVESYPNKDAILKGSVKPGGGAPAGGGQPGSKTMSRSQFDALAPAERVVAMSAGTTLTE